MAARKALKVSYVRRSLRVGKAGEETLSGCRARARGMQLCAVAGGTCSPRRPAQRRTALTWPAEKTLCRPSPPPSLPPAEELQRPLAAQAPRRGRRRRRSQQDSGCGRPPGRPATVAGQAACSHLRVMLQLLLAWAAGAATVTPAACDPAAAVAGLAALAAPPAGSSTASVSRVAPPQREEVCAVVPFARAAAATAHSATATRARRRWWWPGGLRARQRRRPALHPCLWRPCRHCGSLPPPRPPDCPDVPQRCCVQPRWPRCHWTTPRCCHSCPAGPVLSRSQHMERAAAPLPQTRAQGPRPRPKARSEDCVRQLATPPGSLRARGCPPPALLSPGRPEQLPWPQEWVAFQLLPRHFGAPDWTIRSAPTVGW